MSPERLMEAKRYRAELVLIGAAVGMAVATSANAKRAIEEMDPKVMMGARNREVLRAIAKKDSALVRTWFETLGVSNQEPSKSVIESLVEFICEMNQREKLASLLAELHVSRMDKTTRGMSQILDEASELIAVLDHNTQEAVG